MPEPNLSPLLVWGVFPRMLGAVFLLSFLSLGAQVLPWAGAGGVLPARLKLRRMREDFSPLRRVIYFPTLLWLSDSDSMLRAIPVLGALAAAGVIYGGPLSCWGLLACYVLYLSLDVPFRLAYPWECVLLESGLFALFLAPTLPLPSIEAVAAPPPAVAWFYRLLIFRVVVGFGKFKFIGSAREDSLFLKGFLINQPLPTKAAWYAHRLPHWVLKFGLLCLFVSEIPLASLVILPGPPGLVGGAAIVVLMLVIQLSGNFAYFNLIMLALCWTLLDSSTPAALLDSLSFDAAPAVVVANVVVGVHTLGALMNFPFNMYSAHYWLHWPFWLRLPRLLQLPFHFYRGLHSLRWLHPYGVFPPKSMAAVRNVAIVEATWDGEHWHELPYRFAPTRETDPPTRMAPHHVRLDQSLIYETYGTVDYCLVFSVAGSGIPYHHARRSDPECLLQRVLEGSPYTGRFFDLSGLPAGAPKLARMRTAMLEPTAPAERRETGRWWTRSIVGPHLPARARDEGFWDDWSPDPPLWDWDNLIWRRRSRLVPFMKRARSAQTIEALTQGGPLTAAAVDEVFDVLVPRLAPLADSWRDLKSVVDELRATHDRPTLRRMERSVALLCIALDARLAPLHLGRGMSPPLAVPTYLHVAMLAATILLDGREVYQAVLAEPESALQRVERITLEAGLSFLAAFRLEALVFEAQKIRLLDTVLVRQSERNPSSVRAGYEGNIEALARRIWGVAHLTPFLRVRFTEAQYSPEQPEKYPLFDLEPDGDITRADEPAPPMG